MEDCCPGAAGCAEQPARVHLWKCAGKVLTDEQHSIERWQWWVWRTWGNPTGYKFGQGKVHTMWRPWRLYIILRGGCWAAWPVHFLQRSHFGCVLASAALCLAGEQAKQPACVCVSGCTSEGHGWTHSAAYPQISGLSSVPQQHLPPIGRSSCLPVTRRSTGGSVQGPQPGIACKGGRPHCASGLQVAQGSSGRLAQLCWAAPRSMLPHPARPCLQVIGRSRKQKVEVDCASVTEVMQVDGKNLRYKQMEGAFSQPNGGEPSSPWQQLTCQQSVLLHLVSNTAVRETTDHRRGSSLAVRR